MGAEVFIVVFTKLNKNSLHLMPTNILSTTKKLTILESKPSCIFSRELINKISSGISSLYFVLNFFFNSLNTN